MIAKPQIYVASLADYNAGRLHGAWIDASLGYDEVMARIQDMLDASEEDVAEDWAIHDTEGFFGFEITEYKSIQEVCEIARVLVDENYNPRLISELYEHMGRNFTLQDAVKYLEDCYQGVFDSWCDYGRYIAEEWGYLSTIPQSLLHCIDFKKFTQEMEMNGEIFTFQIHNQLHVFWNR